MFPDFLAPVIWSSPFALRFWVERYRTSGDRSATPPHAADSDIEHTEGQRSTHAAAISANCEENMNYLNYLSVSSLLTNLVITM